MWRVGSAGYLANEYYGGYICCGDGSHESEGVRCTYRPWQSRTAERGMNRYLGDKNRGNGGGLGLMEGFFADA